MRTIRLAALIALTLVTGSLAYHIYTLQKKQQALKEDYTELSSAKYGIFNVDEWKGIAEDVIIRRVQEFEMDSVDRSVMRERISTFLYRAIGDFEKRYYRDRKGIRGALEGAVASVTNIFSAMKKDVPVFTEQILAFMSVEGNRESLQDFVIARIDEYMDETFATVDYSVHDQLIEMYGASDRRDALDAIADRLSTLKQGERPYTGALLVCALLAIISMIFLKRPTPWEYGIFVAISFCLLVPGVMLPMIDIDARIAQLSFQLLGEPVAFQDQVLYFRSKSIIEVVDLMLSQGKLDLFIVGLLVLAFSVLFPVTKLLSSLVYLFTPQVRRNAVIRFLVFKTAKWSMADVMVIAVFMSYIGFSGIISEQLRHITHLSVNVDVLTTNETCLQTGFYLFIAFVLLSLIISHRMQYSLRNTTSVNA